MTGSDRVPDTVTEAVELLRSQGYTADFELIDGTLRAQPDVRCTVDVAEVEQLYRFEGPSDPGDEMIVFGLRDPATNTRGTLAAAFGHSADPELAHHLTHLRQRFG
jgi:hypothetical protein